MKNLAIIGLIVTSIALTACGKGTTIPSNYVIPGNSQNYISTPTYVLGTDEYAAFYAINNFRHDHGLGYWQQNTHLDDAAQKHMVYSISNDPTYQQDLEVTSLPNFYAITPSERAIVSGYYVLTNTISATNVPTAVVGELYSVGTGADAPSTIVGTIANTIYHRSGLMAQSTRHIGLARDTSGTATAGTHWWISHARLDSGQTVASNFFSEYPLNGQTDVRLSMTMESPSVFPALTTPALFNSSTSSPVSVHTSSLNNLSVTSFTVSVVGSSTPLPGKVWTMANDPNLNTSSYSTATQNLITPPTPTPTIPAYEAYWVGTQPFQPNTTYTATFIGTTYLTIYGLSNTVTETWNFTTGNTLGN